MGRAAKRGVRHAVLQVKALLKFVGLCLVAGLLLAGVLFPTAGGLGVLSNRTAEAVERTSSDLVAVDPPLVSTITDKYGSPIAYLYDQYRVPTAEGHISEAMKQAIVAVEDKRYFDHGGVDLQGAARALVTDQVSGSFRQGGSTLTQQYVKNYLAYVVARSDSERQQATDKNVGRKLREMKISLDLEKKLSKDQILTKYLNVVPYGNGTFGIGAAAATYFNTTPEKLTVPQSALLAAVVNAPSALSPTSNPDDAKNRRDSVIKKMAENGSFGIDPKVVQHYVDVFTASPLGVVHPLNKLPNKCENAPNSGSDGFFCAYVQQYLESTGISVDNLIRGGYTVRTTLDPKAQQSAKAAAEAAISKNAKGIANAMAIVQPGKDKHRVVALAANRDYGNDPSKGQNSHLLPSDVLPFGAGSIYKIFTTAAALEKHVTGINQIIDVPPNYTSSVFRGGNKTDCPRVPGPGGDHWYCLGNTGNYQPQMPLTQALATSPNTAFVELEEKVGVSAAVDMATRLGLREGMNGVSYAGTAPNPKSKSAALQVSQAQFFKGGNNGSFTLGPGATSIMELSNVGATLMSGGTWCPPTPIESITDRNGHPVPINEAPCDQAIAEPIANTLVNGLSQDSISGTSKTAAAANGWTRPMLGKTGTTQDNKNAAFLGATGQYSGAVMTLNDGVSQQVICKGNPPYLCGQPATGKQGIFGGDVPSPTWFKAMTPLLNGQPVAPLPPPDPAYM